MKPVRSRRSCATSARPCPRPHVSSSTTARPMTPRRSARDAGGRVLSLPFNLGVGGAMRTGFRFARDHGYRVVIQVDADGQHDPQDIPRLVAGLGNADLVIGSRFTGEGSYGVRGPRRWAMHVLAWAVGGLAHRKLTDVTSGFKAAGRGPSPCSRTPTPPSISATRWRPSSSPRGPACCSRRSPWTCASARRVAPRIIPSGRRSTFSAPPSRSSLATLQPRVPIESIAHELRDLHPRHRRRRAGDRGDRRAHAATQRCASAHAVWWLVGGVLALIIMVFPQTLTWAARLVGIAIPHQPRLLRRHRAPVPREPAVIGRAHPDRGQAATPCGAVRVPGRPAAPAEGEGARRRRACSGRGRSPVTHRVLLASRLFVPEVSAGAFRLGALAGALARRGAARSTSSPRCLPRTPCDSPTPPASACRAGRCCAIEVEAMRGYIQYLSFDAPLLFRTLFRRFDVLIAEDHRPLRRSSRVLSQRRAAAGLSCTTPPTSGPTASSSRERKAGGFDHAVDGAHRAAARIACAVGIGRSHRPPRPPRGGSRPRRHSGQWNPTRRSSDRVMAPAAPRERYFVYTGTMSRVAAAGDLRARVRAARGRASGAGTALTSVRVRSPRPRCARARRGSSMPPDVATFGGGGSVRTTPPADPRGRGVPREHLPRGSAPTSRGRRRRTPRPPAGRLCSSRAGAEVGGALERDAGLRPAASSAAVSRGGVASSPAESG